MSKLRPLLSLPWIPMYTQEGNDVTSGEDGNIVKLWALAGTVLFTVSMFIFEDHLDRRQKHAYERTDFPKELETTVLKMDNELKQMQQQKSDVLKVKPSEEEKTANSKKEEKKSNGELETYRNQPILP